MNKEVLILTGLHSEISTEELKVITKQKLTKGLGTKTTVLDLDWKSTRRFAELEGSVDNAIRAVDGRVVLVGIDIASVATLIARQKHGCKKVSEIISVCGWNWPEIGLRKSEAEKLKVLRSSSPSFNEAIRKYTNLFLGEYDGKLHRIADRFEASDWNKILTFVAKDDEIVPRSCNIIGPVMEVVGVRGNHTEGIVNAFKNTKKIKEFIERS